MVFIFALLHLNSSTSNVEFRRNTPGSGRNAGAGGDLMNKVSSKGLIPPLVAAATLFVVLAGGAVMYKKKRSDMQEMKGGQWLGVETATMNDCTASLDTRTAAEKRGFSQNRQNEASNDRSINIPEKEKQIDPDLQGWSEFFETAEERADHVEEDKSQYSIEDFTEFVNEQERSVLHARIRYPDTPASNTSTVSKDSERTDPQSI